MRKNYNLRCLLPYGSLPIIMGLLLTMCTDHGATITEVEVQPYVAIDSVSGVLLFPEDADTSEIMEFMKRKSMFAVWDVPFPTSQSRHMDGVGYQYIFGTSKTNSINKSFVTRLAKPSTRYLNEITSDGKPISSLFGIARILVLDMDVYSFYEGICEEQHFYPDDIGISIFGVCNDYMLVYIEGNPSDFKNIGAYPWLSKFPVGYSLARIRYGYPNAKDSLERVTEFESNVEIETTQSKFRNVFWQ